MNSQSQAFLVQELFERFVNLTSNSVEAKDEYLSLWKVFSGFLKKSPLDYEEIYSFIRDVENMNTGQRPSTTETLFDTEENVSLPRNAVKGLRKMISMEVPPHHDEPSRVRSRHESLIPFKNHINSPPKEHHQSSDIIYFDKSCNVLHRLVPHASEYIMNSNSVYANSMIANFGNPGNSRPRNISDTYFKSVAFAHFWKLFLIEDSQVNQDFMTINLRFFQGDDIIGTRTKLSQILQFPKESFLREISSDLRLLDYIAAYLKELIFHFLEDWEVTDKREKLMKEIMLNSIIYSDELLQISAHVLKRPIEMHFYSQKKIEVFSFSKKSECSREKVILFYDENSSNCMNFIDSREFDTHSKSLNKPRTYTHERKGSQIPIEKRKENELNPQRTNFQFTEKCEQDSMNRGRSPNNWFESNGRGNSINERSFQGLPTSGVHNNSSLERGFDNSGNYGQKKQSMEKNNSSINLNYQYGAPINGYNNNEHTPKSHLPSPFLLSNRNSIRKPPQEQIAPFNSNEKRKNSLARPARPAIISPKSHQILNNMSSSKKRESFGSASKVKLFNPTALLDRTNLLISLMDSNNSSIEDVGSNGYRRISNF